MQDANEPAASGPAAENAAADAAMDLSQQLAAAQAELARLREQSLRERADLENQRRRLQRDVDSARRFANERLLSDLLPVLDSLKAGLSSEGADVERLREGMQLTLKQLRKMAADHGLVELHPDGQAFDPERHQAMSTVVSATHAANTVVQVCQDGYLLHDRLLRPALVVVAAEGSGDHS